MSVSFWSNVGVAIQSALGSALTLDAISQANPGVVEYTGTDPSNGDYMVFAVQGMHQLNKRVVRVANVDGSGDDFELENVDTSAFAAFSSGTAQKITFGTSLSVAAGVTTSGGEFEFADTTTIHDSVRKQSPTVAAPLVINFDCFWDPADAGLAAFKAASEAKTPRAVKLTFGGGAIYVFSGYVGCSMLPTGNAQDAVKTAVTITAEGVGTAYAS